MNAQISKLAQKKFSVIVVKFKLLTFIAFLALLLLVRFVALEMRAVLSALLKTGLTEPAWAPMILNVTAYLAGVGIALLLLVALWNLAVRLLPFLIGLFTTESIEIGQPEASPIEAPPVEETTEIANSLVSLDDTLTALEADKTEAVHLLTDAEVYSATLVSLIKTIAMKSERYRQESETLTSALNAIAGGQPLEIVRAAGEVGDTQLQSLLLCNVQDKTYWLNISRALAVQIGVLNSWSENYQQFAGNLLADFSQARARLTGLQASSNLLDAARPMLQIQDNLNTATEHLRLAGKPGLNAVHALPSIHSREVER